MNTDCLQCGSSVIGVDSHQFHEGWVHKSCFREFDFQRKGLVHKCPQCNATGKVKHPTQTVTVERHTDDPVCYVCYNGCRGCYYCRNRMEKVEVPKLVECPLCKGVTRLDRKPKPITEIVRWELE